MEGSIVLVSLPMVWFGASQKHIKNINTNFYFSLEEGVCVTDYTSGQDPAYGFLKRETGVRKGHPIYFRIMCFDKYKEITLPARPDFEIFGYGNQVSR